MGKMGLPLPSLPFPPLAIPSCNASYLPCPGRWLFRVPTPPLRSGTVLIRGHRCTFLVPCDSFSFLYPLSCHLQSKGLPLISDFTESGRPHHWALLPGPIHQALSKHRGEEWDRAIPNPSVKPQRDSRSRQEETSNRV